MVGPFIDFLYHAHCALIVRAWFIPLHNGTTSVGIVMNQKLYNEKVKESLPPAPSSGPLSTAAPHSSAMTLRYVANIALAPGLVKLLTSNGQLIPGSVKSASDYSYSAPSYAGPGYRIVGDAGGKIILVSQVLLFIFCRSLHRSFLLQWHTPRHDVRFVRRGHHLCVYSTRLFRGIRQRVAYEAGGDQLY